MTDAPELMGTAEVAEILGISRQRVLRVPPSGFSEPVAVLRMGEVRRADAIRAWAAERQIRRQNTDR